MSERYKRLFLLDTDLYTEGSPVIILAGALLMDNMSGRILAQCKFMNVTDKKIKAISVIVNGQDSGKRPLGESVVYDYLDLSASYGEKFGQENGIPLPIESTRSFDVKVKEVIFDDNSIWTAADQAIWEPIPRQKPISITDPDLLEQYKSDINPKAKYDLLYYKDLWQCNCGTINKDEAKRCHGCGIELASMEFYDSVQLTEKVKEHLEKEEREKAIAEEKARRQAEEQQEKKEKIKKNVVKAFCVAAAVFAAAIAAAMVIIPRVQEEAVSESTTEEALNSEIELIQNANIGETVVYGHYEQDRNYTNGKEPIEWIVLDKNNEGTLLISKYVLDTQPYNRKSTSVTWENSSLRTYLNTTFFDEAFSDLEATDILTTSVKADANPKYSVNAGIDTQDKVFLLSIEEAEKYFSSDEDRKCVPTAYAIVHGAYTSEDETVDGEETCWWWLRSTGESDISAAGIRRKGEIQYEGNVVESSDNGVRPAIWIKK